MSATTAAPAARRAVITVAQGALLVGPTALAFASGGYFDDARLTAGIIAWVLAAILALVAAARLRPAHPGVWWALGGLAALTAWAALSQTWAPLAGPAGEDWQRGALYLGALLAGSIAWRARARARHVEPGLAAGILVICGYGLLGRLLPGVVELGASLSAAGRLEQPLTYWNATGALAALGVVLCARVAGDRSRPDAARIAGAAAGVPIALALYLAYSRGAFAALGAGILVLILLAPTWAQLRAAALVVEAGAVVALIASRLDGFASLAGDMGKKENDGALMIGVLVLAVLGVALVQGYACRAEGRGTARLGPLPLPRGARVAGWAIASAIALFPYVAAVVERDGTVRQPTIGATAQRLTEVGSNRYSYWRVAARSWAEHPVAGVGAGGFAVEWLRERDVPETVHDAHSLYLETAAELGIVGLAALLALFAGVAAAARRVWADDPALATGPVAALVAWAVHAGVDWDWEMPALTLVAISLAGLLLARTGAPAESV